jgi:hypothetical protein
MIADKKGVSSLSSRKTNNDTQKPTLREIVKQGWMSDWRNPMMSGIYAGRMSGRISCCNVYHSRSAIPPRIENRATAAAPSRIVSRL